MREVTVDHVALLWGERVQEAFDQRRLAHPAGARDQAQFAHREQTFQAGEAFLHAPVLPQGGGRRMFRKGKRTQLKMFQIHQESPAGR